MTAKQFNARHGLSVGSPPIDIIDSNGLISNTSIPNLDASKITSGVISAARLPSYVDDVLEAANLAAFPATGETGKIYVALDTNKVYRWSGSVYVYITSGAVDSVAGKTGVVTLVKADVGLGSVDNTADSAKNVLSATKLTTARTITIGNTGKSIDGSANVTWTLAEIGVGADTETWLRKVATYTAVAGDKLIADTSGGVFTITLPNSPTTGTIVTIVDGANWSTNNLTVARNAQTIEALAEDLVLDISNIEVKLVFDGTTWQVYAAGGPNVSISNDTSSNSDTFYPTLAVNQTSGGLVTARVSSTKLYFNPSTGQLNATNFNSLSDKRKKTNIITIPDALSIIQQLRGVTFNWQDTGEPSLGLIAQELEQVLPVLVSTSESTGEKSVSYGNIVGVLIEAIKQQQQEIELLKQHLGL
jgi:hypothetical protein